MPSADTVLWFSLTKGPCQTPPGSGAAISSGDGRLAVKMRKRAQPTASLVVHLQGEILHPTQIRKAVAIAAALFAAGSHAAIITFDDLDPIALSPIQYHLTDIPNGYAGLTWQNMGVSDMSVPDAPRESGYGPGTISPNNVAFNNSGLPAGFSSTSKFTLESAYFTAAWNDGLQVDVQGSSDGVLLFSTTFTLNTTTPSLITFNWSDIDAVTFFSHDGTPVSTIGGSGTHFALDNLSVSAVPELGSNLMTLMGLLAIGGVVRQHGRTKP